MVMIIYCAGCVNREGKSLEPKAWNMHGLLEDGGNCPEMSKK